MSTFLQMQSQIADDLDRTDLTTQIKKAINRSIEYYEKERFWFNEKVSTFSTVANQKNYSSSDGIPTDIAEIDYVEITISGKEHKLKRRTYDYVKERIGFDMTGEPTDYCYYQENFYLYPIPNAVRTITVSYQQKYSELSGDTDTNDFTTEAEDLIESRARWWLYLKTIKDSDQAQIAKSEEIDALLSLRAKTEKLLSTGFITPTQF
jgi:hypothetical protein